MNATQFPAALDDIGRRFDSEPLTEAMEACHDHVVDGIRDSFVNGIGPDGEIWPARKDKATHPLLNMTGELMDAYTGGAGHVRRIGYREMQVGAEKADTGSRAGLFVHQYGATIYPKIKPFLVFFMEGIGWIFAKKVTIPARPVGITSEAKDACRETISEAVLERVFRR